MQCPTCKKRLWRCAPPWEPHRASVTRLLLEKLLAKGDSKEEALRQAQEWEELIFNLSGNDSQTYEDLHARLASNACCPSSGSSMNSL